MCLACAPSHMSFVRHLDFVYLLVYLSQFLHWIITIVAQLKEYSSQSRHLPDFRMKSAEAIVNSFLSWILYYNSNQYYFRFVFISVLFIVLNFTSVSYSLMSIFVPRTKSLNIRFRLGIRFIWIHKWYDLKRSRMLINLGIIHNAAKIESIDPCIQCRSEKFREAVLSAAQNVTNSCCYTPFWRAENLKRLSGIEIIELHITQLNKMYLCYVFFSPQMNQIFIIYVVHRCTK